MPNKVCPSCGGTNFVPCPINSITAKYCMVCVACNFHSGKGGYTAPSPKPVPNSKATLLDYLLT